MSINIVKDDVQKLLKNIEAIASKSVLVGIPSEKKERKEGDITNAEIGFIHEYGSPMRNIPARPFLVSGVKASAERVSKILKAYASDALNDASTIDKGLHAAGLIAQSQIKKQIVSQEGFVPLSSTTLKARAAKGFKGTKALIRTGQLLNSITFVVRKKKYG